VDALEGLSGNTMMIEGYTELATIDDERYRRERVQTIELGLDAEQFLHTKLGQYLEKRALDTALDAMQALKTCDPNDAKTVQVLQNAVFRAESFTLWLDDCINQSKVAQNEVEQ
jgi:hypothetical protein